MSHFATSRAGLPHRSRARRTSAWMCRPAGQVRRITMHFNDLLMKLRTQTSSLGLCLMRRRFLTGTEPFASSEDAGIFIALCASHWSRE